jgi:hypothetical protein
VQVPVPDPLANIEVEEIGIDLSNLVKPRLLVLDGFR